MSMVVSFIPSFVPRWGADKKAKDGVQDRRLSPTAYLDGLRSVYTWFFYFPDMYKERHLEVVS